MDNVVLPISKGSTYEDRTDQKLPLNVRRHLSTPNRHLAQYYRIFVLFGLVLLIQFLVEIDVLGMRIPGTPSSIRTIFRKSYAWTLAYRNAPDFNMFVDVEQWTPERPGFPSPASVCRRVLSGALPPSTRYFPLHDGINSTGSLGIRTDRELCEALEDMRRNFRVFTYTLPRSLSNPDETCAISNRAFDTEHAVIRALREGPLSTQDPAQASLFLLPTTTCTTTTAVNLKNIWRWVVAGFRIDRNWARTDAALMLTRSLEVAEPQAVLRDRYDAPTAPRFSHMFVVSSGLGCELGKLSTLLDRALCLANNADDGYAPHKVTSKIGLVPAFAPPLHRMLSARRPFSEENERGRTTLAYFSGNVFNYKGTSCRSYLGVGYNALAPADRAAFRFVTSDEAPEDYLTSLLTSRYCLQPYGHRPHSPRLAEAVWAGCVPVILAEEYDLPHSHVLDWSEFAVLVPGAAPSGDPSVCASVFERLKTIPESQYQTYRRNLIAVQSFFAYEEPSQFGDQLWLTMLSAWRTGQRLRDGAPNVFKPYPKEREGKFT